VDERNVYFVLFILSLSPPPLSVIIVIDILFIQMTEMLETSLFSLLNQDFVVVVVVVLGLKLRAFTLSHSTSPIFVKVFPR
jgi:hypothetical protein